MDIREAQTAVKQELTKHHDTMIQFLRDIVAIPSFDSQIGQVGDAIGVRMVELGFDEVRRDSMGNILGRIGNGPRVLLYDSHIDTVGVADAAQWGWDPFKGKFENGIIYGLGAGDEKCSTPPMIYAMATLKKLGLAKDWTLYYFGNMEEWCDGISGNALIEHEGIRPDFVVIGESTNMEIYRGHRGRTEISVTFKGVSCHASAPERGDNALYKAVPFIQGIEQLHQELKSRPDPFLGAGSITVTSINTHSVSLNAVPDECSIYLDRRMHPAETKEVVLNELRALPNARLAEIVVPEYAEPSYTGFVFPVEKIFPAWSLAEDHPFVQAGKTTFESCYGRPAKTNKWVFSTNATYWMGKAGIPTIGFGPGEEHWAHTTLDQVPAAEVVQSADFYAMLPLFSEGGKMSKLAVVAIGGNSLIKDESHKSVPDQFNAVRETAVHIAGMIEQGWNVVVTHGNGPQVGFILLRSELASKVMHIVPLDSCGADTQGAIGYMIQQALYNEFLRRGIQRHSTTLVTQVIVDRSDPAMQNPSKPIGSFYKEEEARAKMSKEGWIMVEDSGRGWRRVVPSPIPREIVERDAIDNLIKSGFIVIAVGGGGIPVVRDEFGTLSGVEAVIDKDLASSLLASELNADLLLISTAVEKAALNFKKPDQIDLNRITLNEAKRYFEEGHFAKGSMGPKVKAVINYLEHGGSAALITMPETIGKALKGETGTWIVKE